MIRATIYLKTGQVVTVYLAKLETQAVPSDTITELAWKNQSRDLPGLFRIDVKQIVAITTEEIEDKGEASDKH